MRPLSFASAIPGAAGSAYVAHPNALDPHREVAEIDANGGEKGYEIAASAGAESVGIIVSDPSAFNHRALNVYFTSADNTVVADWLGDWTLVLGVVS